MYTVMYACQPDLLRLCRDWFQSLGLTVPSTKRQLFLQVCKFSELKM